MWKPQPFVYTKFGDFMTPNPVRNPAFFSGTHRFVVDRVPLAMAIRTGRHFATPRRRLWGTTVRIAGVRVPRHRKGSRLP